MPIGIVLGLFMGSYMYNPQLRKTVDSTVKKAVAMGIDALNGKGAAIIPPQETAEEE